MNLEPQAYQAQQPESSYRWIVDAARRLSLAASELKSIEGMSLEPDDLSDAWDHAYAELYRANEELIQLLPVEPKPELR